MKYDCAMMHVILDYILPLFLAWHLHVHCISYFYAGVYVIVMYEGSEVTFFDEDSRKIMTSMLSSDIPLPCWAMPGFASAGHLNSSRTSV